MIDELASGIPYASAAQIETAFDLSYTATALLMFVVPGAIAMVVEPFVFLLADRYPRALFLRVGVSLMAISLGAIALAPNAIVLSLSIAVFWIAIGSSVSLAQATLVDRYPDARGRTMARWTLLSSTGDFLVPLVIGGVSLAGHGWRIAHVVVAIAIALFAVLLWRLDIPASLGSSSADSADGGDGESLGLLATLRDALTDRVLMAWLFGVALCDLLDEILVVFATIHVRDQLGGGTAWQSAMILAMTIGGGVGLVALDRLLVARSERSLLLASSIGCAIAFLIWVFAPVLWLSVALMAVVGMFAAPLYPLAAAQAYARRPDASGSVLAAQSLFTPLGLALPFLVGVIADRAGTYVALLVLVAQPVGLVALVTLGGARTSPARGAPPDGPATPLPPSGPPA